MLILQINGVRKMGRRKTSDNIKYLVLTAISLITIFPLFWLVMGSVKTSKEAMNPEMIFPDIIH